VTVAARASDWARGLPDRHGRRALVALCLICALGFGLRVNRAVHPVSDPGIDAVTYGSLARDLYQHHRYGSDPDASDWSPGAPLLYAGVYYASAGEHPELVRLVIALIGLATIVVCYLLGRRLAGTGAGLLAALGAAVYPAFIYDTGRFMSEPPAMLALATSLLAFLWADERRSPAAWAVPGALLGATALIRPEYLAVGLALAVLALFRVRSRGAGWRPGFAAGGVLVVALCVVILPWTVRNLITLDRIVPISTGGGKALFIGTYLPGDGDHFKTKVELYRRFHPHTQLSDAELLGVAPRPLFDRIAAEHGYPEVSRDAALARAGRQNLSRYLVHHPVDFAAMMARKVHHMWGASGRAMRGTAANALHVVLLVLGLTGLALLAARRRWEAIAFAVPIAGITLIGSLLLAGTRRNLPLMPLVIVLAATALYALAARLVAARRTPDAYLDD
jgi:4-amino-4-deoxy-L-arabinose transferase-like glycosyltransferase